jgi:arsenical pump membrane protein
MNSFVANAITWAICLAATAGVVCRPFRLPEMLWALAGAFLVVLFGLLPLRDALRAVAEGNDVYLFLAGMMLLSEIARREGLFDWIATFAVNMADGSTDRLFALVYGVGTMVTVFLSNDATAVVLTPAVFAVTRKAKVDPLPFLFVCALVANAASFVLPISNPANLVLYGDRLPSLLAWLGRFLVPALASIIVTYFALRFAERDRLGQRCERDLDRPKLTHGGKIAFGGIILAVVVLLSVSSLAIPLGLPTAIVGIATLLAAMLVERKSPWPTVKDISWSVLPLVAGLFVLVEALARSGVIAYLAASLHAVANVSDTGAAAGIGGLIAFACNLMNNLPAGLIARSTLHAAHASHRITDAALIGVDLGPNLSITGSLATILWLASVRRDGEDVSALRFLKVGMLVMPPALAAALLARLIL